MERRPLTRDEVKSVIEGRAATERIPMLVHFWVLNPERFGDRLPAVREVMARYPMDAQMISLNMPALYEAPEDDGTYRWIQRDDPYAGKAAALDHRPALTDWDDLDEVIARLPNPDYPGLFRHDRPADGRYRLGYWWYWLFERHWSWRGMESALTDYYSYPDRVHRLFAAWTSFYIRVIERARAEIGIDGIMISDDLGTQTGVFFSPAIFAEFYEPYYRKVCNRAHELGLHLWLHACGRIDEHLTRFVDMGLDVIHPIQKYAMDYGRTAEQFGGKIAIWAGLDVQRTIPWGTPEDVRAEVRTVVDTFGRPDGRLLLAAGNAINEDCPIANLEALLDEAYTYRRS